MIKRIIFYSFLIALVFRMVNIPSMVDSSIGRLPVLHEGRVKPMDTLARHYLIQIQGRLRLPTHASPTQWLFQMMTVENSYSNQPIILVEHPQLFDSLDKKYQKQKYRVSDAFLSENISRIEPLIKSALFLEKEQRTSIQQAAYLLSSRWMTLQMLRYQLFPFHEGSQLNFWNHMLDLSKGLNHESIESSPGFNEFLGAYDKLRKIESKTHLIFGNDWQTLPQAALDQSQSRKQLLENYLLLSDAFLNWQSDTFEDKTPFEDQIKQYSKQIRDEFAKQSAGKHWLVNLEYLFNVLNPFSVAMVLYGLILMIVFFVPFIPSFNHRYFIQFTWFLALSFHTFGLCARMAILMRPPVINLYSSAVFIAFVTSMIGYIMYKKTKALFAAGYVSALSGLSLIVAYHLSLSGDTLEVMQAVLNSNFWLSTHVITITIGYAIIFMAGFFAISYILIGTLTTQLTATFKNRLARMVYIFLMVSLFFNLLGTVLGGIWADQSWGRFWGWDPKENGAILIVLWTAIILHMKWGGLIKKRGLMVLTIGSNIVTAWSWKGTNMLGIGLHSYGFTESTFYWLLMFFAVQFAIMALGLLPNRYWRSEISTENNE